MSVMGIADWPRHGSADWAPPATIRPTLIGKIVAARCSLDVFTSVALAVRRGRNRRGLSQRALAGELGWGKSSVATLETRSGRLRFSAVVDGLGALGYGLAVVRRPHPAPGGGPGSSVAAGFGARDGAVLVAAATPADGGDWTAAELIARQSDGRRYPGHAHVVRAGFPPTWWWCRYGYGFMESPLWTWTRDVGRDVGEAARVHRHLDRREPDG